MAQLKPFLVCYIQSNKELHNSVTTYWFQQFDLNVYTIDMLSSLLTEEGIVHCVNTVTVGSTYYVTVLNPGLVDGTQYRRFTCYVC